MADVPLRATPRTVTVRVRSLVIAGILAALVAGLWWTESWLTGMAPLASGSSSYGPAGLPIAEKATDAGPAVYGWRSGGRFVVDMFLHNSSSVPVTITGVDHTFGGWVGPYTGPTPGVARDTGAMPNVLPFSPIRIPADGTRGLALVFHANPKSCGEGMSETDAVTIHFTVLGFVHNSQTLPLDEPLFMNARRPAVC